jgi:hypothetical protein
MNRRGVQVTKACHAAPVSYVPVVIEVIEVVVEQKHTGASQDSSVSGTKDG